MAYFDYERTFFSYLENLKAQLMVRPLNLGGVAGSGGGVGGNVGGYVGYLPQTRVAYDLSEIASAEIPASGLSLLDNLNHIRYRLSLVESSGVPGSISVYEDGNFIASGITVLDFIGASVELTSPGVVTITFSGTVGGTGEAVNHVYNETLTGTDHFDTLNEFDPDSLQVYYNGIRQDDVYYTLDPDNHGFTLVGFTLSSGDELFVDYDIPTTSGTTTSGGGGHTIQDEGISLPQRTYLNFVGAGVTVVDDEGANTTRVTISGGGTTDNYTAKVSSNDTTANYLASKLVAGSNISITENNNGSNETLTIATTISGVQRVALLTFGGTLSGVTNPFRVYNVFGQTVYITKVFLGIDTAPTGQALIVDVHKNGTTIFTTQSNRPQIADGQNTGESTTINVSTWSAGEYLTAHIDQVGSTVPGSDLTVHIVYG